MGAVAVADDAGITSDPAVLPKPNVSVYWPWVLLLTAGAFAFWPLIERLPSVWFANETYYAHGSIIPFCSAFIIYDRLPRIRETPVNSAWWALVPLLACLYVTDAAAGNSTRMLLSCMLIVTALWATLFVGGFRQLRLFAAPIFYLAFGLPIWDNVIDRLTQPIQYVSTDGAFQLLRLAGQHPFRADVSNIFLSNFSFDVGVPCSGLKLLLAVASIVVFFMLVAHLKLRANLVLAVAALPLAILVNSVRICMIGLVGNYFGSDAGHAFHDYSGYISLIICFGLLYKLTKTLGWR